MDELHLLYMYAWASFCMPCLFVVFKKAVETQVESVVRWFAGPMIHVDIVPGDDRLAYTSYMFETFSVNPVQGYSTDTHVCLNLQVTQEEHDAVREMLARFVHKGIQYNYNDVFRCMLPGPTAFDAADVQHEHEVKTLYCSQAVLLVLRSCLDPSKDLVSKLATMNSRFTTPNMLYNALQAHAEPAETFLVV